MSDEVDRLQPIARLVAGLADEMDGLKSEASGLKDSVALSKTRVYNFEARLDQFESRLAALAPDLYAFAASLREHRRLRSNDIVEQLRRYGALWRNSPGGQVCFDAAHEIDRLRQKLIEEADEVDFAYGRPFRTTGARYRSLIEKICDALQAAYDLINSDDRGRISFQEWDERLAKATQALRTALDVASGYIGKAEGQR